MPRKYTPEQAIEQFWNKIAKRGPDDCWEWQRHRNNGYGLVRWNGNMVLAHRVAYTLAYGDPGELDVLHDCDNPPCCNPRHLVKGTHSDNMRDMIKKGRGNHAKGEQHSRAKLTAYKVGVIRNQYDSGGITLMQLAAMYNVSFSQIHRIVKRKQWR